MTTNEQQHWYIVLLLLLSASSLGSACSTIPTQDATPTPTPAYTVALTPTAEPTVSSSPTLHSVISPASDLPLAVNNAWVFQTTRYEGVPITEIMSSTLVISETVVEVKSISPYLIATIRREEGVETPIVVPPSKHNEPPRPATSSIYWLVVSENRIYRQEKNLDLPSLGSTASLALVTPLNVGDKWYLSDEKAKLYPNLDNEGMLRRVSRVGSVTVPAGKFENCFFLTEDTGGNATETWFCPHVGFVEQKSDHRGTPMGWHQVLIRYFLK